MHFSQFATNKKKNWLLTFLLLITKKRVLWNTPRSPLHAFHRRTGPVWFSGAEVSCPNIFSLACLKIKWFFARIWLFANSRGGGGGVAATSPPPPPPPPRTPMTPIYIYMSVGDTKAFQNNFAFIISIETCLWLKRVSVRTFWRFIKAFPTPNQNNFAFIFCKHYAYNRLKTLILLQKKDDKRIQRGN